MSVQQDELVVTSVPSRAFHDAYVRPVADSRGVPQHAHGPPRRAGVSAPYNGGSSAATPSVFTEMECVTAKLSLNAVMAYEPQIDSYHCEFDEDTMRGLTQGMPDVDMTKVFIAGMEARACIGFPADRPLFIQLVDAQRKLAVTNNSVRVLSSRTRACGALLREGTLFKRDDSDAREKITKYGGFSVDLVKNGVIHVPERGRSYYRVPVYPNAMFIDYALQMNKQGSSINMSNDSGAQYMNVEQKRYEQVVAAYEDLCVRRDKELYNLTECSLLVDSIAGTTQEDASKSLPKCSPFISLDLTLLVPKRHRLHADPAALNQS